MTVGQGQGFEAGPCCSAHRKPERGSKGSSEKGSCQESLSLLFSGPFFCLAVTQVPGESIWVVIRDAQELESGGAGFEACSVLAPVHLSLCPSGYFNTS